MDQVDLVKNSTNGEVTTVAPLYAYSRVKRGYDLVLALALLLMSLPVLVPAVLVNTIVTAGHPVFVQRRIGKGSEEFGLIKLRTMRRPKDGESWSHRTDVDDVRVTFFGKVLRRLYIDELPQLINVFSGQMSMIGPRPETLETTQQISESHPRFIERILVKPGITGVAQVFFRKPENDMDLWRRYYYDRAYITRSSIWFDLKITFQTIAMVLRYKGT
jgi:lipopolysaccharide/colanic/teichoic acid biosynthesis glycosyltransferase